MKTFWSYFDILQFKAQKSLVACKYKLETKYFDLRTIVLTELKKWIKGECVFVIKIDIKHVNWCSMFLIEYQTLV